LKYNCNVVVGYPEKVDPSSKWPTGPEYYNSALIVNRDGETIANYRKSFLYAVDETWALEGGDGFYEGHVPGIGHVSMGICKTFPASAITSLFPCANFDDLGMDLKCVTGIVVLNILLC
jgi:predicted amidohydrolase